MGPAGGAIVRLAGRARGRVDRSCRSTWAEPPAKICLIDEGRAADPAHLEVDRVYRFKEGSGLPLRIPVIEMVEIARRRLDRASRSLGRVAVGPGSAGSEPGPACYARGGVRPTVTDADVALGLIDPTASRAASSTLVRSRAGRDASAWATTQLVAGDRGVAGPRWCGEHGDRGPRARDREGEWWGRTLIAFGGAAPLHAARVAEKIGVERVLIPPGAGVGSAVGFLVARFRTSW